MKLPSSWRRRARPGLGTLVDITFDESDAARAEAAFDAAFVEVALVHRLMSAHDPASDIRRLSESAHLRALRVHPQTLAMLRLSRRLHRLSGGIFDIAVGAELAHAGHVPRLRRAPSGESGHGSSADIVLRRGGEVSFKRPLHLDMGGLAKGHAVDCAVRALQSMGIRSGLVNAGGDMRAFGAAEHPVHLRFADGPRAVALLRAGALAASCHADQDPGAAPPHLDARTRQPLRSRRSVLVHSKSAALADGLTKVAMACPQAADRVCEALGAQWRGFDYFGNVENLDIVNLDD